MLVAATLTVCDPVCGQAGVSSMSYGAMNAGLHLDPDSIRVEELINYHRHKIPLPEGDEQVHLDLRWATLPNGRIGIQTGLTTARATNRKNRRPLNLVLVIDKSGSMSGERIAKVKQSLQMLIERLNPTDHVSIVAYDNEAHVVLDFCHNADIGKISKAIDRIEAGGSTNLHHGLMLGYEQATAKLDQQRSNRVILLTDGRANVGVSDPDKIARDSKRFNDQGIELSTIGLGNDFNRELLRDLADAGRGAVHFVDDPDGMRKIFVDEFDSLLSNAAQNIRVELDFGECQVAKVYGYEPVLKNDGYQFRPDNMGHGATQVILAELSGSSSQVQQVTAKLTFDDCVNGQRVKVKRSIEIDSANACSFEDDPSLVKNFSIAKVADSIRQSAKACVNEKHARAVKQLKKGVHFARRQFRPGADEDVDRMVDLAKQQLEKIQTYVADQHQVAKRKQ